MIIEMLDQTLDSKCYKLCTAELGVLVSKFKPRRDTLQQRTTDLLNTTKNKTIVISVMVLAWKILMY